MKVYNFLFKKTERWEHSLRGHNACVYVHDKDIIWYDVTS